MAVTLAGGKKPAPKKPPVKRAPVKTLGQMQAEEAARIAKLAIDPAVADVNTAIAAAEAQRVARLKASEGATRAVAEMSAGDAEQARAAYAQSADFLNRFGTGLTGNLRSLQEGKAAAASDLIGRLGLPGGVASSGEANANVSHQLGVVIPGEGLANEAPRALMNLQAHRNALGARLADNASLEDFKAGQTVEGIRAKLAEIEAKRPGIIMEALQQIQQRANAERATNVQIGYLQLQQAKTVYDQAKAMTNLSGTLHIVVGKGKNARVVDTGKVALGSDAIESQTRAATSRANAAAQAATSRAATAQRAATADKLEAGRNARAKAANAAKVAAAKIKTQQAQQKPATVSQKNTVINGARATGVSTVESFTDRIWDGVPNKPGNKPAEGQSVADFQAQQARATNIYNMRVRQSRARLVATVTSAISTNLRLIGYTPAQIKQFAEQLVGTIVPAGKK